MKFQGLTISDECYFSCNFLMKSDIYDTCIFGAQLISTGHCQERNVRVSLANTLGSWFSGTAYSRTQQN
jgi:hypothetical protein